MITSTAEELPQLIGEKSLSVVNQPSHDFPKAESHPFVRCVNPHLADVLGSLWLDKRFVRGTACELFDENGRSYLDCIAAYGALPFGFNPPEIWQSILEVQHSGEPSIVQPAILDAAGELAERLLAIGPPNLRHVTFANSGAETIEAAIKLCRIATGRMGILSASNSFHGKTLGALSATGNPYYQEGFGAPSSDFQTIPYGDTEALRQEFEIHPGHFAAFLVEPIQGEGGIVVPPSGYLTKVRDLCTRAGVLLVMDEIQTGLGRTGEMFASMSEGVQPDVMTLAKALGGGLMPIGAMLCTAPAFTESFALRHSSTFAANTLACRAGLAALQMLTVDNHALVRRVARNGARLKDGLVELQRLYPQLIAEVRGRGFLLGIRFASNRLLWPESLLGVALEQEFFTPLFASYMLNVEGVRVAPTLNGKSVIRVEPALNMTWPQCEQLLCALGRTLAVFETGDTGRILASIIAGRPQQRVWATPPEKPWVQIKPRPAERRFAFLMHPLEYSNAVDLDSSLACLDDRSLTDVVRRVSGLVDPFVVSHGRVVAKSGETVYGEFITLPRTAKQLAGMRKEEGAAYVRSALHMARDRGAEMVGLGAFTSVVTLGGRTVANEGVPVTTGNSFAAVASVEAARKALHLSAKRDELPPDAAIVGATGAIGRAMALMLAEDAGRLTLVGNPNSSIRHVRERLLARAADLVDFVSARHAEGISFKPNTFAARLLAYLPRPTQEVIDELERTNWLVLTQETKSAVRGARLVVTATSATGTIIEPEDLRPHSVVCDVSRPANVSRQVAAARPDVLVIDGGVIAVPAGSILSQFGLGDGLVYACMAETMMLTLAGHLRNTSVGTDLTPETLHLLRSLADQYGFEVARLRSFGLLVEDDVRLARTY